MKMSVDRLPVGLDVGSCRQLSVGAGWSTGCCCDQDRDLRGGPVQMGLSSAQSRQDEPSASEPVSQIIKRVPQPPQATLMYERGGLPGSPSAP